MNDTVRIVNVLHQTAYVGQQNQLFCTECNCQLAGCGVGVDVVVSFIVDALCNGRNDRNIALLQHIDNRRRVYVHNVADVAVIRTRAVGQALRLKQAAVHAAETDAAAACLLDQGYKVLVDLAAQHHLDDIHGFTIGIAQAVDKLALLADLSQHFIDLRAAAVYDNDLDADQIEQYQIVDDRVLQLLVDHCVAAVFYNNGLTVIFLNIRKCFDQNIGAQLRIKLSIHTNSFLYPVISSDYVL